jgi:energy-coupling factor transport system ATP-binding protein
LAGQVWCSAGVAQNDNTREKVLQAKQVSFRYPQENQGLAPISLDIKPGEITLVTGPSGCGKSTLARCLMGLIPHLYNGELSGEVWLNGYQTVETPMWQLSEKAGMVFQNPTAQMLAPSVADEIIFGLENLGLKREEISERLETALQDFDLTSMRDRNPQTLSGGEQQKLALAAIMARQPESLILDEPLSMLDTTAAGDLISYLERFAASGKTVAMFEHRQEYLDGVTGLRHLTINGTLKPDSFSQNEISLPAQENFELEVDGLCVHLGGRAILQDFDLSLSSGQIVSVVGRNGVGKTTLLRALSGLQKHDGIVRVITSDGDQPPDFGMVFQNPDLQLFNASVRDEILYHLPDPDLTYYKLLLATLGLERYENTPPLLLSEGEKKRVALGLTLMRQPTHGLLLDEPSLGQDSVHKTILTRTLRKLADAGQLVVMTTHDLTLASQADHLVLLGTDGVIAEGKTDVVLQDYAAWKRTGIALPDWFLRGQKAEAAQ